MAWVTLRNQKDSVKGSNSKGQGSAAKRHLGILATTQEMLIVYFTLRQMRKMKKECDYLDNA